jgi:hypothetical protein
MSHAILAVFLVLGSVDGRIVDFRTQQPIANVEVRATSPTVDRTTHTDAHGDFALRNLPAGEYKLSFVHPLYFANSLAVLTIAAGQETHLQVSLKRALYTIDGGFRLHPYGWPVRPGVMADTYFLGGGMPIFGGPPNVFGAIPFVPGVLLGIGPRMMR